MTTNCNTTQTVPVGNTLEQGSQPFDQPQQDLDRSRDAHWFCLCASRGHKHCNTHGYCDTIITYKDPDNGIYDMPGSTWSTARNAMYYLARQKRAHWIRKGEPIESHYCFLDGDTLLNHINEGENKGTMNEKLKAETELHKVIAFNYRRAYPSSLHYIYYADANAHCFSSATIDEFSLSLP